jgi:hypothetical protein
MFDKLLQLYACHIHHSCLPLQIDKSGGLISVEYTLNQLIEYCIRAEPTRYMNIIIRE